MRLVASIQDDLLDSANSLTHTLIKMHRVGHNANTARAAFAAIHTVVDEALAAYDFAIAQPEPRAMKKDRVVL